MRAEAEDLAAKQGHASAIGVMRSAIKAATQSLHANDPRIVQMLVQLADYHWSAGQLKDARRAFEQALFILEQHDGAGSADAATVRYRLGLVSFDMGNIQDAAQLLRLALTMREVELGERHPDVAISMLELAMFYGKIGKTAEAELLLQRAVELLRFHRRDIPKSYARGLTALAWHEHLQHRDDRAVPLCEEALDVDLDVLGPAHSAVATDLSNLAALYQQAGRYEEAGRIYARAVTAWNAAAPDDPKLKATWQEYAVLLRRLGKLEEARQAETQAQAVGVK